MRKAINQNKAHSLANASSAICYFMVFVAVLVSVLALLGRVKVTLEMPEGKYNDVLLIEQDHSVTTRFMLVNVSSHIYIDTIDNGGEIEWLTRLGVAAMGLLRFLPIGYCFFKLASFFNNIAHERVFVADNADILQKCGKVLLIFSIASPIPSGHVIRFLINRFTNNVISLSSTFSFSPLFLGIVLLVVAYVFRYGLHLQDEADHTL